jgi:hypothetical protein
MRRVALFAAAAAIAAAVSAPPARAVEFIVNDVTPGSFDQSENITYTADAFYHVNADTGAVALLGRADDPDCHHVVGMVRVGNRILGITGAAGYTSGDGTFFDQTDLNEQAIVFQFDPNARPFHVERLGTISNLGGVSELQNYPTALATDGTRLFIATSPEFNSFPFGANLASLWTVDIAAVATGTAEATFVAVLDIDESHPTIIAEGLAFEGGRLLGDEWVTEVFVRIQPGVEVSNSGPTFLGNMLAFVPRSVSGTAAPEDALAVSSPCQPNVFTDGPAVEAGGSQPASPLDDIAIASDGGLYGVRGEAEPCADAPTDTAEALFEVLDNGDGTFSLVERVNFGNIREAGGDAPLNPEAMVEVPSGATPSFRGAAGGCFAAPSGAALPALLPYALGAAALGACRRRKRRRG